MALHREDLILPPTEIRSWNRVETEKKKGKKKKGMRCCGGGNWTISETPRGGNGNTGYGTLEDTRTLIS